jgi:hypothetical protein
MVMPMVGRGLHLPGQPEGFSPYGVNGEVRVKGWLLLMEGDLFGGST